MFSQSNRDLNQRRFRYFLIILILVSHFFPNAQAQVVPDTTLGNENSDPIPTDINQILIDGGAKREPNLFHSFSEFNVLAGEQVYFTNPEGIEHIITRVTGNNVSNILGTLGVLGNANLFILNPNGLNFGNDVVLDVNRAFVATSGESIQFADDSSFTTTGQLIPSLTVSTPIGIQLGVQPGQITSRGTPSQFQLDSNNALSLISAGKGLQVNPGQTLSLIGGDINLIGSYLSAEAGNIELWSVADFALALSFDTGTLAVTLPVAEDLPMPTYQNIVFSEGAAVDVSGAGSGEITIAGRTVTLQGGSAVAALTQGANNGGVLNINASESLSITGRTLSGFRSGVYTQTFGTGNAGELSIQTPILEIRDDSIISASTFAGGRAGDVRVQTQTTEIVGESGIFSDSFGSGNAGNLTIETNRLTLLNAGQLGANTSSAGRGGELRILKADTVEIIGEGEAFPSALGVQANPGSTGDGGNLVINTNRLLVQDGGLISASTLGNGQGGGLEIDSQDIEITGTRRDGRPSRILSASLIGTGNAGNLIINTERLTVQNGAEISVSSVFGSLIGQGSAGNLEIQSDFILLNQQANISAASAVGDRANITLNADDIRLLNNSDVSTNAIQEATGGTITINTDTLVALENSDITANAEQASGGQVIINAQGIFGTEFREQQTEQSDITASSELGAQFSGVVEISTPDVDPAQGLVDLPENVVDVAVLIEQGCAVVNASSFTVVGRGGLPPSPGDTLSGDALWVDLGEEMALDPSQAVVVPSMLTPAPPLVEAQGWYRNAQGKVVLTAQAETGVPQGSRPSAATCSGKG